MKRKSRSKKLCRKTELQTSIEWYALEMSPAEWSQAVQHLAHDLAAERSRDGPLTHAECEEALLWYVSDLQFGNNVRQWYPRVWQHLQLCPRCTESLAFLTGYKD